MSNAANTIKTNDYLHAWEWLQNVVHIAYNIYKFETGNDLMKINELKFAQVELDC